MTLPVYSSLNSQSCRSLFSFVWYEGLCLLEICPLALHNYPFAHLLAEWLWENFRVPLLSLTQYKSNLAWARTRTKDVYSVLNIDAPAQRAEMRRFQFNSLRTWLIFPEREKRESSTIFFLYLRPKNLRYVYDMYGNFTWMQLMLILG